MDSRYLNGKVSILENILSLIMRAFFIHCQFYTGIAYKQLKVECLERDQEGTWTRPITKTRYNNLLQVEYYRKTIRSFIKDYI